MKSLETYNKHLLIIVERPLIRIITRKDFQQEEQKKQHEKLLILCNGRDELNNSCLTFLTIILKC